MKRKRSIIAMVSGAVMGIGATAAITMLLCSTDFSPVDSFGPADARLIVNIWVIMALIGYALLTFGWLHFLRTNKK